MEKRTTPPDLNEITVFVRVADLGSFSKAARSLGRPVSTVSRKVSELEGRLGVALMRRSTRRLSLTEAGALLFERCAQHLEGIEDAEIAVAQRQHEPSGTLRVTVPVAMGGGAFIDFVSSFLADHPKVGIDLVVTNQHADLISEKLDVAIRFGRPETSSLVARRLGTSRRQLLASPRYIEAHPVLKHPRDLREHRCVLFHGAGDGSHWDLRSSQGRARVRVTGSVSGSDFNTVHALTVRGHGIALLPQVYCPTRSDAGDLRPVLPAWSSTAVPVYALYTSRHLLPARTERFLQRLVAWKSPHWS